MLFGNVPKRETNLAKGVIMLAHRQLTHHEFKEKPSSGLLMRTQNYRLASNSHQIHTVNINKVSLNTFDIKRYIHDNGTENETTVVTNNGNVENSGPGLLTTTAIRESD